MKKTSLNIFIWLVNLAIIGFFAVLIAGAALFAHYVSTAPKLTEKSLTTTTSSKIYDSTGQLIADLGAEKRENATTAEIPTDLVNAIVAIEDHRFFKHRGIDVIRIGGAFLNNLTKDSTQGGSTLDQQFIKLTYFSTSTKDQTIKRKAQEAWLALQLERRNTKQEILTYYVNKVYMSNRNYGMKTAAQSYYGKELKDLSIAQLALLAGMPQAPNQYDPYTQPEAAKERRDLVLKRMRELEYLTKEQYKEAIAVPITEGLQPLTQEAAYPAHMDNYIKEVIEEVEEKTGYNLLTTGMDVYTNVDPVAQQQLWDIYNTDQYVSYPDNEFQVASTVVEVSTGKVIAQLGARHQASNVSFGTNQAVETNRDWGSTMKPITDYAPALEHNVYDSTADIITDVPYSYPGTSTPVNNWDHTHFGSMTLRSAILYSRNVPAVKALEAVGLEKAHKFLNSIGIVYPELLYSNAISSNTFESDSRYGASSEKMAAAYAAFSNGGTYYKPQYVHKIVFSDGTTSEYKPEGTQVMSKETAYMMTDMMKSVLTAGTGANGAVPGVPQAGKTGTSNYTDPELEVVFANHPEARYYSMVMPDENFVGFSTKYAMAVWTGYTNRMRPLTNDTMYLATDVYRAMMTYLHPADSATDWDMPSSLTRYGNYVYKEGATTDYYSDYSSSSSTTTSESSSSTSTTSTEEAPAESSSVDPATSSSTDPAASSTTPDTGASSEPAASTGP